MAVHFVKYKVANIGFQNWGEYNIKILTLIEIKYIFFFFQVTNPIFFFQGKGPTTIG